MKPTISKILLRMRDDKKEAFNQWQADFHAQIVSFKGFSGLEISNILEKNNDQWVIIEQFIGPEKLREWLDSQERKSLMTQVRSLLADHDSGLVESLAHVSQQEQGVVEVIVTAIEPSYLDVYKTWLGKIHACESQFPGFQRVYVQPPRDDKKNWITLLQFNTIENLDRWLISPERKRILEEGKAFIEKVENHRLMTPFRGWFNQASLQGKLPSVWKQTMLILLMLFPIIMLEQKFLSPLLLGFNSSLSTFIGNAISVSLLAWPLMPICIRFLNWWLNPNKCFTTEINLFGTSFVLFLYLIEIIVFWNFF